MSVKIQNSVKTTNQSTALIANSVKMYTKVHRGLEALRTLRTQWEGLHAYCDLWARFEWYYAYITNLAVDSECIYFIQVIVGEETVAIIPAEISRQKIDPFGNLKVLCLAFHSHIILTDFPLNPHIDPARLAELMLKAFRELPVRWDVIQWPRIMHSSNALKVACSICGDFVHIRPASRSNSINTSNSFDEVFNTFSKNLRKHLNKSRKLLSETANWQVKTAFNTEDISPYYDEFLRIESSGWKGDFGTVSAISLNEGTRGFYATLLEQRGLDFIPEVTLMSCGSRVVSGQFTIWTQGIKHILKIGYDENFSKLSPGQILLEEVLRSACGASSIERVNLVTNMQWHLQWHPTQEFTFDIIIFRRRLYGVLFGYYLHSRRLAKLIIDKVINIVS